MMRKVVNRPTEKMSDCSFRGMILIFKVIDFIYPYVEKRIKAFNIARGMTIVDYGCGPGRYTMPISQIVGDTGKVYALDIHEMALKTIRKKIMQSGNHNIETKLIKGIDDGTYDSGLPDNIADMVCAIDMFFIIKKPAEFLREIRRILKHDGILIIDDGHQSRKLTKKKISDSGFFIIHEETRDHLKCKISKT